VKKDEWTAYSDKVKSDLEVPAKRHMKSVEVPTGEKSMFGLGKEIMKTEKKPTKNVVISERDYKNLVTAARDNDRLKQHVRNLDKKDEWTAYSDKVKSDLEVPAKRHMKSVEVPTGEKSMFGLGKEIMKTEKKPTKNVVISERDYKNLVTAARDNDRLKQHVRN